MVSDGVWGRACAAALSMAALFASGQAHALPSTKVGTAPLVAPSAADSFFGSSTTTTNGTGASGRPKEVVELARALKNDPDLIYEYVRNNTTTTFTYGLSKGSVGVIIDRAGTAFDQAELMADLLRQAGYTATYDLGTITLSGAQFQAWTGVTSAKAACQLLSSGGIPAIINGATTPDCSYTGTVSTVELSHAWVSVVIGGVSYVYDPAYKDHTFKAGLNLAAATAMPAGMATSLSASSGTTSGVPYISSYNSAGLATNLSTYAGNLETYINANAPSGDISDVVGGKAINAQAIPPGGLRQLSLPYTTNIYRTISGDIPDQYRIKLRIQITKARPDTSTPVVVDKTVFADEVYGRRLTFEPNFDVTGASFTGALKLTDDLGSALTLASVSYADNPSYSRGTITLILDLPYAANSGGYMDASVTRPVSYALPFTIVTGFGDVGRGLVDKWGQRRDSAMPAPPDMTCKVCYVSYKAWKGDGRRETLAAAWLAQASRAGQLHAAIGQGVFAQHYSIGVSAADTTSFQTANGSWWITESYDRLEVETGFSLTSLSADATLRRGAVFAAVSSLSALKGSVSGQISDMPDVSTVATRFQWGNAPGPGEDPPSVAAGGYINRKFYDYANATQAAQALALSKTEYATTTTATGIDSDGSGSAPTISNTEVQARRQALANAVSDYVAAGFDVLTSEEAFLGPGQRAAAFVPSGSQYSHQQTPQRGGAIAAIKYDANGDPTEIADVLVNPVGYSDAGGAGAQIFHQAEYDPATSADVVKGRFVLQPTGAVIVDSPATVKMGAGNFPYALSANMTWRGGDVRDQTYEGGAHREPQGGWTTNYTNTLTISGSGLEAMGETDPRAAIGTVAAFYAAQDAYRSAPSLTRNLAGQLINAWWVGTLAQNVATAAIGTETRQWIKKPNGQWLTPGAATYGSLAQTNAPVISPRHPNGASTCTNAMVTFVPERGWQYAGVSFTITSGRADWQTFASWANQIVNGAGTSCAEQRGFRLSGWAWPTGPQLIFTYSRADNTQIDGLARVENNINKYIVFNNGGSGGFYASKQYAGNLMGASASLSGSEYSHTDAVGGVTKFDVATIGAGDFAKLVMDKVYAADDGANPATQYVYDTLGRVAQLKDKLALAGSRAPTQYFLANGLRSEILRATGFSSIVYADLAGRPVRTIDGAGAVSTVAYDGRGRPILTTSPDGDQVQVAYNARNLVTQTTKLARVGSAEAGQSIITKATWNATIDVYPHTPLDLPDTTTDGRGGVSNYTYASGELTKVQYPIIGTVREESDTYYYSDGQPMSVTTLTGRNISKTYQDGSTWATLTDTVGSASGVYTNATYTDLGDAKTLTSPRKAVTEVTYDALRRLTLILEPYLISTGTDCCGNPIWDTTKPRNAKRLTYDALGRVVKVERGTYLGTTLTVLETYTSDYDAVGNRVKQTGPTGVVQISYDALNRPVCTAVRMNVAVYDALPADACQPSAVGPFGPDRISRVSYDAAGRVVQTEAGVGTGLQQVTETDTFSPGGQRLSLTDANGNTSAFAYDGFGRLKRVYFPAAPRGSKTASTTDYEEYGYDANGNSTSLRKRDGQVIAYQYDALDRMTFKDLPGTTTDDVYYSYSNHGLHREGRLGSATAAAYWYMDFDQAGRLQTDVGLVAPPGRSASWGGYYNAAYDVEGNRVGNGFTSFTYDLANRLISWGGSPAAETITYGPLNRVSSVTRGNGVVTNYSYDAAGRLVGLSHNAPNPADGFEQTYAYNPAGQLVASDQRSDQYVWSGQPTTTTNFTHDQLNRDAAIAAAAGYDAAGNLISDGTRTFTYDAENRLRSVTGGAASATLDYDPWGRLATYTVGSTITLFRYAGANLDSEWDGVLGTRLRLYTSLPEADSYKTRLDGWYTGTTQPFWFEQDRLGSIVSTSDASGAITPYSYGPYGEPQTWSGSRLRYTGQITLPEIQLYSYRARIYDPVMGRFLQTDPIGYGDGPNIYAYVHGDPLNEADPSGESGSTNGDTTVSVILVYAKRLLGNPDLHAASAADFLGASAGTSSASDKESSDHLKCSDPDHCASEEITVKGKKKPNGSGTTVPSATHTCVKADLNGSIGLQISGNVEMGAGGAGLTADFGSLRAGASSDRGAYTEARQQFSMEITPLPGMSFEFGFRREGTASAGRNPDSFMRKPLRVFVEPHLLPIGASIASIGGAEGRVELNPDCIR